MTGLHRTYASALSGQAAENDWPSGCSTDTGGALRLHGIRLDELAAQWGTPLSVVDESAFLSGVDDLIQIRGVRPLFGVATLPIQTSGWAERCGWDVWGDPAGMARAGYLSVNPRQKVVDLRGHARGADLGPAPSRMVVNARNLDRALLSGAPSDSVYVSVGSVPEEGLPGVLGQLGAESWRLPHLAGLALRLEVEDSPDGAAARVEAAFATLSSVVRVMSRLIVDGGDHPDPLPIVARLVGTIRVRPWYGPADPSVLADVSRWLIRRASVALVRVDSATSNGIRVVGLSGRAPRAAARVSRTASRPGGKPRETFLVWPRGEAFRVQAPDGIVVGDVLALPATWVSSGLCVVVADDGVARAVRID